MDDIPTVVLILVLMEYENTYVKQPFTSVEGVLILVLMEYENTSSMLMDRAMTNAS